MPDPVTTIMTFRWRGVTARVTITRNHRIDGWTLLVVKVEEPRQAPLPFALGGTRTHGLEEEELQRAGGVAAYLHAWADREARSAAYVAALNRWRQGDLFH